ncbi:hypothetical protein DPEC_G00196050 [Dallia pectoralis]|uniref:Uncharacterized protein n=1 Tax=Dallia pectoralis TaxID=75939 RepID=A0ACC2G7K5_DALPE|nr:hypothetical protein DPEC_G00196050 [Dallia pectoralis]
MSGRPGPCHRPSSTGPTWRQDKGGHVTWVVLGKKFITKRDEGVPVSYRLRHTLWGRLVNSDDITGHILMSAKSTRSHLQKRHLPGLIHQLYCVELQNASKPLFLCPGQFPGDSVFLTPRQRTDVVARGRWEEGRTRLIDDPRNGEEREGPESFYPD